LPSFKNILDVTFKKDWQTIWTVSFQSRLLNGISFLLNESSTSARDDVY